MGDPCTEWKKCMSPWSKGGALEQGWDADTGSMERPAHMTVQSMSAESFHSKEEALSPEARKEENSSERLGAAVGLLALLLS